MKHLKVLTALALGVLASSSGMIQVGATTYTFFEDFSTKEVADYDDFKQTFNENTNNLTLEVNFEFFGEYKFDSCPTAFTLNNTWFLFVQENSGALSTIATDTLPDFVCTTEFTEYEHNISVSLDASYLDLIVNDDTDSIGFYPQMRFGHSAATNGRTLSLRFYSFYFDITYNFGTTYLFNYFLSDQEFLSRNTTGTWTFNQAQSIYLSYVYTTAGNDSFYIRNTNTSTIGSTRKKYAVDSDEAFFRGQSVGAGFFADSIGPNVDSVVLGSTGNSRLENGFRYHYLNTANLAQAIVEAPVIDFTEESCSGGFLDINVACYVNNEIAYLVNDAPVISDAFTLLNTGIELSAQTFCILGSFSDDNVFGYLILVGFGFIAVKWFLQNDE